MLKKNNQAGFTVIELLVVVAIIGMLASIVTTSVGAVRSSARDARRKADIKQVDTAIQIYLVENNHAPYLGANNCRAGGTYCSTVHDYSKEWDDLKIDLAGQLGKLPVDPCGAKCGEGGLYFTYFYLPPSNLKAWCDAQSCGKSNNELNQMYIIGAQNLETDAGKWGANHGFSASF